MFTWVDSAIHDFFPKAKISPGRYTYRLLLRQFLLQSQTNCVLLFVFFALFFHNPTKTTSQQSASTWTVGWTDWLTESGNACSSFSSLSAAQSWPRCQTRSQCTAVLVVVVAVPFFFVWVHVLEETSGKITPREWTKRKQTAIADGGSSSNNNNNNKEKKNNKKSKKIREEEAKSWRRLHSEERSKKSVK